MITRGLHGEVIVIIRMKIQNENTYSHEMAFWDIIDPFLLLTGGDLRWIGGRVQRQKQQHRFRCVFMCWLVKKSEPERAEACPLRNDTNSLDSLISQRRRGGAKMCSFESLLLKSILRAALEDAGLAATFTQLAGPRPVPTGPSPPLRPVAPSAG